MSVVISADIFLGSPSQSETINTTKWSSVTSNFVYTIEVILNQYALSYASQPSPGVFSVLLQYQDWEKTIILYTVFVPPLAQEALLLGNVVLLQVNNRKNLIKILICLGSAIQ